jgi:hypothetical protein
MIDKKYILDRSLIKDPFIEVLYKLIGNYSDSVIDFNSSNIVNELERFNNINRLIGDFSKSKIDYNKNTLVSLLDNINDKVNKNSDNINRIDGIILSTLNTFVSKDLFLKFKDEIQETHTDINNKIEKNININYQSFISQINNDISNIYLTVSQTNDKLENKITIFTNEQIKIA